MSEKARVFRSGELARAAGVSADTLRHYERLGVLAAAPRTASGYRVYPAESLERVRMVRHAMQLGFTLADLAEILQVRDKGGAPCKRVLGMLEGKLEALERRISELMQTQEYMRGLVGEWRSRMAQTQSGKKAFLLHTLNGEAGVGRAAEKPMRRKKP